MLTSVPGGGAADCLMMIGGMDAAAPDAAAAAISGVPKILDGDLKTGVTKPNYYEPDVLFTQTVTQGCLLTS